MLINVIGGIVSGVAAGIVLSGFFWLIGEQRRRSERKEQIQYMASLIATYRERLYKPDWGVGPPIENEIGKNIFRKTMFEQMKDQINTALDGRCSRLSFDEINQLRRMINNLSSITDNWSASELNWTDAFCGKLFAWAESFEWLDLPKGPDFFDSAEERGDLEEKL